MFMKKHTGDVITRRGESEWVPDAGFVQSMLRAVVDEAVEAGVSLPDVVRALSSELLRYAEGLTPGNRGVLIAGLTRERIEAEYRVIAVEAHALVSGEDRSNIMPAWGAPEPKPAQAQVAAGEAATETDLGH